MFAPPWKRISLAGRGSAILMRLDLAINRGRVRLPNPKRARHRAVLRRLSRARLVNVELNRNLLAAPAKARPKRSEATNSETEVQTQARTIAR